MKLNFTLNPEGFCKVAEIAENACFSMICETQI